MIDEDLREIFGSLGPISIRRMFSGKGIYFEGIIIAIEYQGELRLKADPVTAPAFQAAGATQWSYEGRRGEVLMPYWSTPPEAFDDPDLMTRWVRLALEAGLRAQAAKTLDRKRKPRKS